MHRSPRQSPWILTAPLLIAACASGGEPAAQPAEAPAQAPAQRSAGNEVAVQHRQSERELELHMRANFLVAVDARDAVIDGDLVRAIEALNWIAEQNFDGLLPDRWKPYSARLQQTARAGAQAQTLQDAAQRVAAVAQRCGECHQNFKTGEDRGAEEAQGFAPVGPEHVETRMVRHQWAADELWHGLVIPSDKTWGGGARILVDAPPNPPQHPDGTVDPQLKAEIADLRRLGERAAGASDVGRRVEVYGDLLGRCAGCHVRLPK